MEVSVHKRYQTNRTIKYRQLNPTHTAQRLHTSVNCVFHLYLPETRKKSKCFVEFLVLSIRVNNMVIQYASCKNWIL
jgi:hypothetical protein